MPRTKKLPILAVFTWSLTLFKIQDGGQDGDHCWWRHRSFFREDQWLSTEGKIVSKYCNISKTLGRGSITPPPPSPPPCITVVVWPCAYVRGLKKHTHTQQQQKIHTHPQTEQYVRTPQIKSKRTTMVSAILRNTLFSYPCFPLNWRPDILKLKFTTTGDSHSSHSWDKADNFYSGTAFWLKVFIFSRSSSGSNNHSKMLGNSLGRSY